MKSFHTGRVKNYGQNAERYSEIQNKMTRYNNNNNNNNNNNKKKKKKKKKKAREKDLWYTCRRIP
jgi:hypothetical protein